MKASLVAFSNVKQLCICKSCLNLEISLQKNLVDLPIHNCLTLEKATKLAFKKAAISNFKNYVILLSPSAASFDQYRNFEDRGNKFKEIVNQQLSESLIK
mgnify:CR=1 FL=1